MALKFFHLSGSRLIFGFHTSFMASNHSELSNSEFLYSLQNCCLDPDLFNHEAHLRLAYLQLSKNPLNKAAKFTSKIIQKYVIHLGAQDKYHHTLTIAAVHIVAHFKDKSTTQGFENLIKEFPRLTSNFKSLINTHYSPVVLQSSRSKLVFVEPDLLTFA